MAFSPGALSSVAYANQEIYLGLLAAGTAGLKLAWPIGLAITVFFSPLRVVIPISGVHRGVVEAVDFACSISKDITAVYVELEPGAGWHSLLHNQTAWLLKAALLYHRRHLGFQKVIIEVPFHLRK